MVREGYKQTEVGVIPEDWKVEKFQDITEVITCGIAATPTYVTEATGEPFLSAQNVRDGKVVYENHKFISKKLFIQITKHNKPSKGDILYTRVGAGIGDAGVIEDDFEFAIYVSLTLIKPKCKLVDSYFISNLLNSNYYKFLAKNGQFTGAGVQNLNVEVVRNFAIPLPPKEEQKAIAQVLCDVDALIAALDKLITKKRHIKTGTMQKLLAGKKRLPGFGEGKGYKQTEIGVIPEDWEVRPMSSLASIQRGASPRPIDSPIWYDSKSVVGWVRISDVTSSDGKSLRRTRDYLSVKGILQSRFLPVGSLIMSICATVGIPVITQIDTCIHDGFVGLSNLQDVEQEFLYYKLKELEPYFKSKGQTGSQSNLNSDIVRDCQVALPPLSEQRAITQVLSDIDNEITALETRRAKTQAIKQGMMQELLTGKTRLI